MGISKKEAIQRAERHMGGEYYSFPSVTEHLPDNCAPYWASSPPKPEEDYWYLVGDRSPPNFGVIKGSRLIVVSQRTGEVIFDGSASNEG